MEEILTAAASEAMCLSLKIRMDEDCDLTGYGQEVEKPYNR